MIPYKSLHVAIDQAGVIGVWLNDGDAPVATCVDLPTAHLFAAAPDMLSALQSVLAYAEDGTEIHPDSLVVDEVRAAIAKAVP